MNLEKSAEAGRMLLTRLLQNSVNNVRNRKNMRENLNNVKIKDKMTPIYRLKDTTASTGARLNHTSRKANSIEPDRRAA